MESSSQSNTPHSDKPEDISNGTIPRESVSFSPEAIKEVKNQASQSPLENEENPGESDCGDLSCRHDYCSWSRWERILLMKTHSLNPS